ncbi:MAG: PBP1A family penicillin-binding protein [Candidatus Hydrogenedentota bacterium]
MTEETQKNNPSNDDAPERQAQVDEQTAPKARGCGFLFFLAMIVVGAMFGVGLGVFVYILEETEETIEALEEFRPKVGSKIFSADGEELGEFAREARQVVPLNAIPLKVQKAFIATEDDTFYEHQGVRPLSLMRAVLDSFRTNHLRGASTITQQIVRNIDVTGVSKEQTVQRKLREMLVALQLERQYTKDEILELYLNQIFLGVSAYGVESAARQYYLKNISDLTLGEAALLAGLTRSPNINQPFKNPDFAEQRRNIVLRQMYNERFITEEEFEAARVESVADSVILPSERALYVDTKDNRWTPNKFKAPYFSEDVRKFMSRPPAPYQVGITQDDLFEGGLEISTTIDLRLQKAAEDILLAHLDTFDEKKLAYLTKRGREAEFVPVTGALVCLDNRSGVDFDHRGYIRAMVGGRNFDLKKFNNATQAKRQPGSSVKPFVWLTALDNGMTPSDYVTDERVKYIDAVGTIWEPKNFSGKYLGPMPMRKGLEQSKNIISIKLAERFTTPLVRSYMRSAGFKLPIAEGLSMALGSSDTRIIDHAESYTTLANGGIHIAPTMITQIKDRDGIVRFDINTYRKPERVFPADATYQIVHLMQGVCEPDPRGRVFPSGRRTRFLERPRAGKTGTSNRNTNVWFCGFTPQYTCILWIGYADNRPLGKGNSYTGGALASPVWTEFMIAAHEGLPVEDFKIPAGVEFYKINRITGLAGGEYTEAYIRGTKPLTQKPIQESSGELESLFLNSDD